MISKIIKGTGIEGLVSYGMDRDHRVIIGGTHHLLLALHRCCIL